MSFYRRFKNTIADIIDIFFPKCRFGLDNECFGKVKKRKVFSDQLEIKICDNHHLRCTQIVMPDSCLTAEDICNDKTWFCKQ